MSKEWEDICKTIDILERRNFRAWADCDANAQTIKDLKEYIDKNRKILFTERG